MNRQNSAFGDIIKNIHQHGKKIGVMIDKNGELQIVEAIKECEKGRKNFQFSSYNLNCELTNRMFVKDNNSKKKLLYLSVFKTMSGNSGKGLGSNLNEFMEDSFTRQGCKYKGIIGRFFPSYFGAGTLKIYSQRECNEIVRYFYEKNGYEIIYYKDFEENPEKYPYIRSSNFGKDYCYPYLIKKVYNSQQNPNFQEINNIIVKNDVPEMFKEQIYGLCL